MKQKKYHKLVNFMCDLIKVERKYLKAREIRQKYGQLTTDNISNEELQAGIERQWRRFNCSNFQRMECQKTINRVFKESDNESFEFKECNCDYCTGKVPSLLKKKDWKIN